MTLPTHFATLRDSQFSTDVCKMAYEIGVMEVLPLLKECRSVLTNADVHWHEPSENAHECVACEAVAKLDAALAIYRGGE